MGERVGQINKVPEVKQSNSNSRVRRTKHLQSMDTPVDRILYLQRTVGNQAVSRLMRSGALQTKLRIGQPGDVYEQEADRVADAVMWMPELGVQRQVERDEEEEETLYTKGVPGQTSEVTPCIGSNTVFSSIVGYNNFAKIECDINIHPEDLNYYFYKNFRTVGTGKPKILIQKPEVEKKYPCLFEAVMEHEYQHVKNNEKKCVDFKKCIDEHTSKLFGFLGKPKISYKDFIKCHNKHHGGFMKDCIADEKSAYEAGIKKAKALINKKGCSKEKDHIDRNIKYWEKIKDNAPNCKKQRQSNYRMRETSK